MEPEYIRHEHRFSEQFLRYNTFVQGIIPEEKKMEFIKLTEKRDEKNIYLNVNSIVGVYTDEDGDTHITTVDEDSWVVKEQIDEVVLILNRFARIYNMCER